MKNEFIRYINNAKKNLNKAKYIDKEHYLDEKYITTAGQQIWLGFLKVMEYFTNCRKKQDDFNLDLPSSKIYSISIFDYFVCFSQIEINEILIISKLKDFYSFFHKDMGYAGYSNVYDIQRKIHEALELVNFLFDNEEEIKSNILEYQPRTRKEKPQIFLTQ